MSFIFLLFFKAAVLKIVLKRQTKNIINHQIFPKSKISTLIIDNIPTGKNINTKSKNL